MKILAKIIGFASLFPLLLSLSVANPQNEVNAFSRTTLDQRAELPSISTQPTTKLLQTHLNFAHAAFVGFHGGGGGFHGGGFGGFHGGGFHGGGFHGGGFHTGFGGFHGAAFHNAGFHRGFNRGVNVYYPGFYGFYGYYPYSYYNDYGYYPYYYSGYYGYRCHNYHPCRVHYSCFWRHGHKHCRTVRTCRHCYYGY